MTWNDEELASFIGKHYPFALAAFLNARNHAEAADIARYLLVYHYGGHYYDWDVQLLDKRMFLDLCNSNPDGFLLKDRHDGSLASEAFSANKMEPYLLKIIDDILESYQNGEINSMRTLHYSGPFRMQSSYEKFPYSAQRVLGVKDVFMYEYNEIQQMPEKTGQYAMIHYWLHSWL